MFSGIFKSLKIIEVSSNVKIIDFSEPKVSSEIPLFPSVPGKGAIIFPLFKWAITSPFLTSSSKFIGFNNSSFFILNEVVFFERAVPKDSWFFLIYVFGFFGYLRIVLAADTDLPCVIIGY